MSLAISVFIDLNGRPKKVGRLWTRVRAGKETASFEYESTWLQSQERFPLEPGLSLTSDSFHTDEVQSIFGSIGDSAPDRWGRTLMRRAERKRATRENRQPRTLFEADFLLLVDDETRQGAMRFKTDDDGPFLSNDPDQRVPPFIELPRLLAASERVLEENETDEDLKLLLAPGSSLGGARPKASVRNRGGRLCLAKFPSATDEFDVVSWEALALTLARRSGIDVPDWSVEKIGNRKVLVIERFDRTGAKRIPFLSAMSMLSSRDNETRSYLEIADSLRMHGDQPRTDLKELWRRIVFNILISNTDDHLRNHGFLFFGGSGWRLSPAYDLNPTPLEFKPRYLSTAIDLEDTWASIDLAMETAGYYGLKVDEAKEVVKAVGSEVRNWRLHASQIGISGPEMERMASAFEHDDLRKASSII